MTVLSAPQAGGFLPARPYRPVVRLQEFRYGDGGRYIGHATTPAWFLNSANQPRDRGKRGVRTRPGRHERFKGLNRFHGRRVTV